MFLYVILLGLMYLLLRNVFQMNILAIVVIIMFIVGVYMYTYSNTNTLQDLQNGQTMSEIEASSLATNGTNAPATNFAYSIWFFVNDFNYRYGEPKVIFGRMSSPSEENKGSIPGINGVGPCPVVVLGKTENNVLIYLSCFLDNGGTTSSSATATDTITTEEISQCMILNVPIQKWVNLVVSVYGRTLDTYIDGKLVRTCLLPGIAKVDSTANVFVTPFGGFDGWTSKFQYFPNALNPQEAYNIYAAGYGNGLFANSYQIQVSLIENGTTASSTTF